jgi:hypothetical protein
MADIKVFNHLVDGRMDITAQQGVSRYVTHIQHGENANTRDPIGCAQLQAMVNRYFLRQARLSSDALKTVAPAARNFAAMLAGIAYQF